MQCLQDQTRSLGTAAAGQTGIAEERTGFAEEQIEFAVEQTDWAEQTGSGTVHSVINKHNNCPDYNCFT